MRTGARLGAEQLNIIFVDDEPRILDGLRRQLSGHRQQWNMRFASSGAEALKLLESLPAQIIVSNMRISSSPGRWN
jgi:response regulator RpfG family c-di-GMP phosphodiesterase